MNRAFHNGISGTKTHQFGIDTWANNISNINTHGFRANIPQFAELFADKLAQIKNTGPVQSDAGFGARAHSSAISLKQGSLVPSDRNMDVAIGGEGWFGVATPDGEQVQYTRNGSFTFNKDGGLVTDQGAFVMGTLHPSLTDGKIEEIIPFIDLNAGQKPITLPTSLTLGAIPTKKVSLLGNLGTTGEPSRFVTDIVNKEGTKDTLEVRFEKSTQASTQGQAWEMQITITDPQKKVRFSAPATPITFGTNGSITNFTPPDIELDGTKIALDFGKNNEGLVALSANTIGKSISKDGLKAGSLIDYYLLDDGHIMARFDNGRESAVGKLGLYHFQNDQGLIKVGDNRFQTSSNSGQPLIYTDAQGRGVVGTKLMPYFLEMSNTSATEALTQLIVMQKAFDANAKSITTGDQLIQAALKMV